MTASDLTIWFFAGFGMGLICCVPVWFTRQLFGIASDAVEN